MCIRDRPGAPQEIGQHVGEDGGHAAGHNDAEGVLPGEGIGVVPGAQQGEDGLHEHPHDQGKQGGDGQPQVEAQCLAFQLLSLIHI